MKKIFFVLILCVAIFLRFFKLGAEPISLDWDEVSLGYNAYSLLLTGSDEYGNSWPLAIRSFNDYKPPAYSYLTIPAVAMFGLTEFATRLPSAVFGSLAVIGVFLLTREFVRGQKDKKSTISNHRLPLVAMFVFAISPWHLQFSRAAFEANISVFFVTFGIYFLVKWMNTKKPAYIILSAGFLAGALYSYHAARMIVPLLLFGIALRYRKFLFEYKKQVVLTLIITSVLVAPLVLTVIRGSASSRLLAVSIFTPTIEMLRTLDYKQQDNINGGWWAEWMHNRRVEYIKLFIANYLNHFNPINMFIRGDVVERHHAPDMGHFYFIELPFMLIGIYTLARSKFNYKFLILYWAMISPLPAAISTGTPHAIRSILFLPIPQIALAIGIIQVLLFVKHKFALKEVAKFSYVGLALLYTVNFSYYMVQYYGHQSVEFAPEWQYGYKELVQKVSAIEDKYDKIVITTAYDQPYIYFLFYKQYDPRIWINDGEFNKRFDKYEFRKIKLIEDYALPNTLLVGEPLEIPKNETDIIDIIKFPDKKNDAFRIYDNSNY